MLASTIAGNLWVWTWSRRWSGNAAGVGSSVEPPTSRTTREFVIELTSHGIREWGTVTGIVAAAVGVTLFLDPPLVVKLSVVIPLGILLLAVYAFFRSPRRELPADWTEDQLISPADGVISSIETHDRHPDLDAPGVVIRIFLSVLDVHVNRWPCNGTVMLNRHVPGRHHDARSLPHGE